MNFAKRWTGILILNLATFPVCAEIRAEGLDAYANGMSQLLTTIDKWDKLIDSIVDAQQRQQLKRRMSRLNRDMAILLIQKQALLDSLMGNDPIDESRQYVNDLVYSTYRLKDSLVNINNFLNIKTCKDVESSMMMDLDNKTGLLKEAEKGLSNADRVKAIDNLRKAIGKLKEAKAKVIEYSIEISK